MTRLRSTLVPALVRVRSCACSGRDSEEGHAVKRRRGDPDGLDANADQPARTRSTENISGRDGPEGDDQDHGPKRQGLND
jgi:hypothetical protein